MLFTSVEFISVSDELSSLTTLVVAPHSLVHFVRRCFGKCFSFSVQIISLGIPPWAISLVDFVCRCFGKCLFLFRLILLAYHPGQYISRDGTTGTFVKSFVKVFFNSVRSFFECVSLFTIVQTLRCNSEVYIRLFILIE